MAGLALHALAVGNATTAFQAFVTTALTIAVVMGVLATAIGLAQGKLAQASIRRMKGSTHLVKRLGGMVLILVGTWLLILAVWAAQFARVFSI